MNVNNAFKILVLSLSLFVANAHGQILVQFKSEHVTTPNSDVSLYDLVSEESKAGLSGIKNKLSSRIITRTQNEGERVELSISSLTEYLKSTLTDKEKDQFRFSLPRNIKILIQTPELTSEYVEKQLRDRWSAQCVDCQIQISQIQLPLGKFKNFEMVIPQDLPKGTFNIPMRVKLGEGKESQYWIQGRVDIRKEVPVAQRSLYIGERVLTEDVKYEWKSVTFATDGAPARNLIAGMRVKVPVAANQVIWSRNLEREKAMKRGDVVRVFSTGGLWELSMTAIAQKDADIGDLVELKPTKLGKNVSGIVTAQGEVEVR